MTKTVSKPDNIFAGVVAAIVIVAPLLTGVLWVLQLFIGLSIGFLPLLLMVSVIFALIGFVRYQNSKDPSSNTLSAQINSGTGAVIIAGGSLFVVGFVAAIYSGWLPLPDWIQSSDTRTAETRQDNSGVACACAQDRVTNMLKSPSTADFPWGCDEFATKISDTQFIISSYVDAQNSFGAMLRSNYTCDVTVTGGNECLAECNISQ